MADAVVRDTSSRRNPPCHRSWIALTALAVSVLALAPDPAEAQGSVSRDRNALVKLYDTTDGDDWQDRTNWKSREPIGQWHGVTTNDAGRVTKLKLQVQTANGASGGLVPAELGNLSELTELQISGHKLRGSIPAALGNLSKLKTLNLSGNQLSGSLPAALGNLSELRTVDLFGNSLSGEIPPELGNLSKLTQFDLTENGRFTGCLPWQWRGRGIEYLPQLSYCRAPAPGKVPGVTVTPVVGNPQLSVSWSTATDADGYRVQWKSGSQSYGGGREGSVSSGTTIRYTITNLTEGTEYTVRVIATRDHTDDGEASDDATGTTYRAQGITVTPLELTVSEAGGTATYELVLDAPHDSDVRVEPQRSAESGSDQDAIRLEESALTFAPSNWNVPQTVTVTGVDNDIADPGGERTVTITHTVMATGSYQNVTVPDVTVTVVDENKVLIDDARAPENEDLTFTVVLNREDTRELTVKYADTGTGTATAGEDYAEIPEGTLTFAPGETSKTITVEVTDDTEPELDETVVLTLSDATGRFTIATDTATGTIVNDDFRFTVGGSDPTIDGQAVTRTATIDGQPVTITWSAGVSKDIEVELPPELDGPLTIEVSLLTRSPRDPGDDRFALGETAADRTPLVDIRPTTSLPGAVQTEGLRMCLPVTAGLVQEARRSGQEIILLRYDGSVWQPAGEEWSVERGLVCASRVTAFSPFAVGYYIPSALSEKEVEDVAAVLAAVVRTLASDAVDVVGGRFDASPAGGTRMALAGHALRLTGGSLPDGREPGPGTWRRGGAAFAGGSVRAHLGDDWRFDPMGEEAAWRGAETIDLSERDLLTGSSFELPLSASGGADGGPAWTVWGRGAASGFGGEPEPGLSLDGNLYGGYLGVEMRPRSSALLGLALSLSQGTVDYERTGEDASRAEIDVNLTGVLPYAHWRPREGLGLWGLLGVGAGEMEFGRAGGDETLTMDLTSFLGAVGGRQELTEWRGIDLAVKADTFAAAVDSKELEEEDVPAMSGDAVRVRMLMEGSREGAIGTDSRLSPRVELGVRWDGGTAEGGLGVEFGSGLSYTRATMGLSVEARGRFLVASSLDEWGASVDASLDPGVVGRGASLTVAPVWGQAASGTGRLWGDAGVLDPLGAAAGPQVAGWTPQHLDVALKYGLPLSWERGTITPYGGVTLGSSDAARYRLGSRLTLGPSLDLSVESNRTERAGQAASHAVAARLGWHW